LPSLSAAAAAALEYNKEKIHTYKREKMPLLLLDESAAPAEFVSIIT